MRWSSIRKGLEIFGDKTFFVYMWLVPAVSIIVEAVREIQGNEDFHLPSGLSWTFGTAVLYYIAHLIYRYQCPQAHKDIQDMTGALIRDAEHQNKLASLIKMRMDTMQAARELAEDILENQWRGKSAFSEDELSRLKPIVIRRYLQEIDNCRAISEAMLESKKRDYTDLDRSKPFSRLAAASFLWLSVSAAAIHAITTLSDGFYPAP
jgi:hypothetical protein